MELNFYPTMDGYFFSGAAKKLTINPGRTLTLSFDSEAPGLSYLHFSNWVFPGTGGGFTVFTNPGDVVRIAFGKTNPRETFKISGNNLAVNQYLARTKRPQVTYSYMEDFWLKEKSAPILGRQIEISLKKEWVNLFNSPLKKHPARPYLEADMYWWYFNILNDLAVGHMDIHNSSLEDWESVFMIFSGREPAPEYSRSSYWFGESMSGLIDGYNEQKLAVMKAFGYDVNSGAVGALEIMESRFKQKTGAETYLAEGLKQEVPMQRLLPVYTWLKKEFPGSVALFYFKDLLEPIWEFERTYDASDSSMLWLPEPQRWSDFTDSLAGTVSLIYIWKTDQPYCLPCRTQMDQLTELQKEYQDSLQVVFLSLDDPAETQTWHKAISFRGWHGGQHLLAKGAFRQDIFNRLEPNVAFPVVFMMDQSGLLLTTNGPQPDDPQGIHTLFQSLRVPKER